jgi:hypothetical protein
MGENVWLPLEDEKEDGEKEVLFPEIEKNLAELQRLGPAIVMRPKRRVDSRQTKKKEPEVVRRLYEFGHARHLAQKARKDAALGKHVTMDAGHHGGMTELGDAEIQRLRRGCMTEYDLDGWRVSDLADPGAFSYHGYEAVTADVSGQRAAGRIAPIQCQVAMSDLARLPQLFTESPLRLSPLMVDRL